ncbi:MAG TPA: VTT domain-containing protein [Thermoanaerobaculia bacterium]|nr:VTT domain-containing protein [Thermoanaerobaculia bacterium]
MTRLLHLVSRYGTPLVWLNVFLEQIGAPIPAVPTLIIAGALARDGKMSSTMLLAGSVVASLVADWIWFLLGRRLGYRVLKTLCRISLSPDSCVRETESRFERWGMRSLLIAKFVPGFSTVAPPLAGASKRSTGEFLIYDGIGAFLWAGLAVAAGRIFHRAIDRLLASLEQLGMWAVLLVVSIVLVFMVIKWWQRFRFLQQLRLARVTPEEVMRMIESGGAPMIIDVRTPSAQRRDPRHLPRALIVPTDNLPERLAGIPRDREIILYCT